jgi:hypothetical protein
MSIPPFFRPMAEMARQDALRDVAYYAVDWDKRYDRLLSPGRAAILKTHRLVVRNLKDQYWDFGFYGDSDGLHCNFKTFQTLDAVLADVNRTCGLTLTRKDLLQ